VGEANSLCNTACQCQWPRYLAPAGNPNFYPLLYYFPRLVLSCSVLYGLILP
jgi:hypothetical protein